MTSTEWKRVAQAIVARRTSLGMKTSKALADKADLTTRVIGDIENARRTNYGQGTKAQVENALRWAPGSIDQIVEGKAPIIVSDVESASRKLAYLPQDRPTEPEFIARTLQVAAQLVLRDELDLPLQLTDKARQEIAKLIETRGTDEHATDTADPPATEPRAQGAEDEKTEAASPAADRCPDPNPSSSILQSSHDGGRQSDYGLVARTRRHGLGPQDPDAYGNTIGEEPDAEGPEDGA